MRNYELICIFQADLDESVFNDSLERVQSWVTESGYRNLRDVWSIPTQAYAEAHFATYPEKLVEPCILAGTSEKGRCPECGAGWERMVDIEGWRPGCTCTDGGAPFKPVPCIVLDPFLGSGTTARVAIRHGRGCIGIELNAEYAELARKRIDKVQQTMFGVSR